MQLERLVDLVEELRRKAGIVWQRAEVDPESLSAVRGETERQLGAPLQNAVDKSRLAYASHDSLDYPDSEEQAVASWASGKTAVLQSLQSEPGYFNLLGATLEVRTGRKVACSAYLSAASAETFDWHVDEWDAFILQLRGVKSFDLMHPEKGNPVREELRPGSALFMPRGLRHKAFAVTDSLHVSINLLPTGFRRSA